MKSLMRRGILIFGVRFFIFPIKIAPPVEMLIVVIIVGILSAAILPRLTGYMARTRDLKRQTDLRNIAAAINMYISNKGEIPLI